MASDYEKIRNANIEDYGKKTVHLAFLGRLYTDRTHFIFEILQNAEDAGASKILFKLYEDRLEVSHNGRLFDERDVKGVCGVGEGTKAEDLTQIGKFGIGFKSVYAYTSSPEIHSGDESFRIEHYVRPYPVEPQKPDSPFTTRFIFPFNRDEVNAETACHEIGTRLLNINTTTLLFLRKVNEIAFKLPDQTGGIYIRETKTHGIARHVTVFGQNNGNVDDQEWLIFERTVQVPDKGDEVKVEVAFQVESNSTNLIETINKISSSPLVVYFPTEKETRFGFLIQGPYRTTPSRDNIPQNDSWNEMLIRETAKLISDVLTEFKKLGLLTVDTLQVLPVRMVDFPSDGMFYPIVDSVLKTLANKDLLPADDGTFVFAQMAKIARGSELRNLLNPEQLSLLLKERSTIKWLSREITQDRTPDLHEYLIHELGIEEITPESFARKISEGFLKEQTDQWLVEFYKFLSSRRDLWKPSKYEWDLSSEGVLRSKPIIRLQNGGHVCITNNKKPNVYITKDKEDETDFPIVKIDIAQQEDVYKFLRDNLEIPELDIVEVVLKRILTRYVIPDLVLKIEEHLNDIGLIKKAYKTDSMNKKNRLVSCLKITSFILAYNPEKNEKFYKKPSEIYFPTEYLKIYFSGNPEVGFHIPEYDEETVEMLKDLGVNNNVKVFRRERNIYSSHITIEDSHGTHRRGLNGFDPDIIVDGLEIALASPTKQKSIIIWNQILLPNKDCIHGIVESSSRQNFQWSSEKSMYSPHFGEILKDTAWLPDRDGNFHKPEEITLLELPEEFQSDEYIHGNFLKKITMPESEPEDSLNPREQQALEELAKGDPDRKKRIESFLSASDDAQEKFLKLIQDEDQPESAQSFKDGLKNLERSQKGAVIDEGRVELPPVSNPDRYQEKLNKQVEDGVEEQKSTPHKNKFSPVKEAPSNAEARSFLYEEYQGHCQITGTTFPKAAKNLEGLAENYFEACNLLSYRSADYLNDAGNMICVSADTMAKLKHASRVFLDDIEDVIKIFKENNGNMKNVSVKILLAGEECAITWSQRHFMRLVALYEMA